MKYQNWKSYLNKSLFILFLALAVFLVKVLPKEFITEKIDASYLLNGIIFLYGIILIFIYLIVNKKYVYLVSYGLFFAILGSVFMFISPLIESYFVDLNIKLIVINSYTSNFEKSYFEAIIILTIILHGIFKLIFNDTYSKVIRVFEFLVGLIYVLVGLVFIYINVNEINESFNIEFMNIFKDKIVQVWFFLILADTLLFVLRILRNRKFIKEEISEQLLESKATFRKDSDNESVIRKRKKQTEEIEVIDLKKFFKSDKDS